MRGRAFKPGTSDKNVQFPKPQTSAPAWLRLGLRLLGFGFGLGSGRLRLGLGLGSGHGNTFNFRLLNPKMTVFHLYSSFFDPKKSVIGSLIFS